MTANTISGLRINQWGVEGVHPTATLTMAVVPTANKTIIIGGVTYTFVADADLNAKGEIAIGAGAGLVATARTNLVAAIAGDAWNDANPAVSMAAFVANDAVLTGRVVGATPAVTGTWTDDAGNSATAFTGGSAAHGTAVAATSKIAIENLEWGDDDENIYRPQFANGLLLRNRGTATAVQHGTRFSLSDQPVVWEQLPHWLAMSIAGGVTPAWVSGATDIYRWTFTRSPLTNPLPESFTLERRYSNGVGGTIDQRCTYAMLSKIGFSYAQNEHLRMSAEGFARKFETNAITGALSLPTAELGVSALSTVYLDASWGAIGGTLLAEQVIGWDLEFGTGFAPLFTAEGRTNLDFTKAQPNAREVMANLKLTILLDPTTYAAEQIAAAAGTRRAIQVKVAGSGSRLLKFNGLFQHTKPALFKIGEQDGQDIVEMELEEATDESNFFSVIFEHPSVYSLA